MTEKLGDLSRKVAEEHEKFQTALGRLTLMWSDAESALYAVLRYYSGTSTEVARALFSGSRARTMMMYVESIAHNTRLAPDRTADLKEVFAQMKAINTMRDWLVHHVDGSVIEIPDNDPSVRSLTNTHRTSRIGKGFRVRVSAVLLHQMCNDLQAICWHLLAHRDTSPFVPWKNSAGKTYAWEYVPPPPVADSTWYS